MSMKFLNTTSRNQRGFYGATCLTTCNAGSLLGSWVCMCVCVYIRVRVCVHACARVRVGARVRVCACARVRVRVCAYM